MVFVNDVFQADVGDVGVDLGGVDVGVSEHELYGTQIDAVIDEVGGEGVAQAVRAEGGDAGGFGVVFDNHPRELSGDAAAFLADKNFVADFVFEQQRPRFGAIAFDPVNGFFAHRHDTQFVAFAYGADAAAVEIEIAQLELLNPRAAILDETDSGLDIDALRIVSDGVNRYSAQGDRAVMLITHYTRILRYIDPTFVHVFVDGRIVDQGGRELADKLEAEGYEAYVKAAAANA